MNGSASGTQEPVMHERLRYEHGLSAVYALAFHPAGQLLALGGDATSPYGREQAAAHPVQLLEATTARSVRVLDGHDQPVRALAFTADGALLISAAANGVVAWDVATGRAHQTMPAVQGAIQALAVHPTRPMVALAQSDGITLWDLASGAKSSYGGSQSQRMQAAAFTHDGALLAGGSAAGTLTVWRVTDGHALWTRTGSSALHCLAFRCDDQMLVTGSATGELRLWTVATQKEHLTLPGPQHQDAYAVAWSSHQPVVAAAFGDEYTHAGATIVWRVSPDDWRTRLVGATGAVVYALALSPDGRILASAGDEDLVLWTIA